MQSNASNLLKIGSVCLMLTVTAPSLAQAMDLNEAKRQLSAGVQDLSQRDRNQAQEALIELVNYGVPVEQALAIVRQGVAHGFKGRELVSLSQKVRSVPLVPSGSIEGMGSRAERAGTGTGTSDTARTGTGTGTGSDLARSGTGTGTSNTTGLTGTGTGTGSQADRSGTGTGSSDTARTGTGTGTGSDASRSGTGTGTSNTSLTGTGTGTGSQAARAGMGSGEAVGDVVLKAIEHKHASKEVNMAVEAVGQAIEKGVSPGRAAEVVALAIEKGVRGKNLGSIARTYADDARRGIPHDKALQRASVQMEKLVTRQDKHDIRRDSDMSTRGDIGQGHDMRQNGGGIGAGSGGGMGGR